MERLNVYINAALGGTLYQDIPTQHPSAVEHHQQPPYHIPSHEVVVMKGSPLYKYLKTENLPVNSCHHQAIKELAPGLEIMAVAPDGLVEAVYMPEHRFLWAVQWHPEFSYQTEISSRRIFSAFVEAMQLGHTKSGLFSQAALRSSIDFSGYPF